MEKNEVNFGELYMCSSLIKHNTYVALFVLSFTTMKQNFLIVIQKKVWNGSLWQKTILK